ncbi:MAG TPA: type IV pilin protein [Gammaproteobacteria bacterium]
MNMKKPYRQGGFTLMELMVVVTIVAIIAAIGYPSYTAYVREANRVDATEALLRIQNEQEKYYLQNNTYTTSLSDLGFSGTTSKNGYYTLAIPNADATTFTATAVPNSTPQSGDKTCQSFSINALNVRTAKDSSGADSTEECWG